MRPPTFRSPWVYTVVGVIFTVILLSPLYWVLAGSLMTQRELFSPHFSIWPHQFVFQNWSNALVRLWPHFATSAIVSVCTSALTLLVTAPAAYAMIWLKVRGRGAILSFMLTSQMLPAIVFVIPLFILFSQVSLVNSLPGLILGDMTFTVPFALIMLSAYIREFPYQLVEAALVDGASQWRAFLSIVLPVTKTGMITVAIFSFLMPWGDLIFALTFITESGLQPLTLELYKAVGVYGIDWSFLLPGSLLTALPGVVFVVAASRFIVAGFTRGALH
ncbi:MAG TPA: carbohydrate ABC transporter permease [Chthoniobacterales bacterium]